MPGKEHPWITELALSVLPEWQRTVIGDEAKRLIHEYCRFPDTYFDVASGGYEKALPYYFETDGIQFHYLPDTPIVDKYRYWRVDEASKTLRRVVNKDNEHYRHAKAGYDHYLRRAVDAIRTGNHGESCRFLGWLLHVLQDSGFGGHSLEGVDGTDLFVLDRLLPEPTRWSELAGSLIESPDDLDLSTLTLRPPRLLGRDVPEAVFHLYTDFCRVSRRARRLTYRIVAARREASENADVVRGWFAEMFANVAVLCADVVHTAFSLGSERFEGDTSHLDRIFLSDMEAVTRPWGTARYRFLSMLRDAALGADGEFVPLALRFADDSGTRRVTYEKGFAMGSHYECDLLFDIPANTYEVFECALGLFADDADSGRFHARLINHGDVVFEGEFTKDHPSERLTIADPGGGFGLRISNAAGMAGRNDHVVWAAPILRKSV